MSLNHILTDNPENTTTTGLNVTFKNVNTATINNQVFPALNHVLYQGPSSQSVGDLISYDVFTNECRDSGINSTLTTVNFANKNFINVANINGVCAVNIYPFIVPSPTYSTIQSCIDDLHNQYLISNLHYNILLLPGTYVENLSMKVGCSGISGNSQSDCIINGNITVSGNTNYYFNNLTVSISSSSCFTINFLPNGLPITVNLQNVTMNLTAAGLQCIAQLSNTTTNVTNCIFIPFTSNDCYLVGCTNGSVNIDSSRTTGNGTGIVSANHCLIVIKNSVLATITQLGDQSYGGYDSSTFVNTLDVNSIQTTGSSPPGNFFVMNNLIMVATNATTDDYLVDSTSGNSGYNIFYNSSNINCIPGVSGRYKINTNCNPTTMTEMISGP